MSYLLDKKNQRKKYIYIGFFVVLFLFLIYFRSGVYRGLSTLTQTIFHPVFVLGNNIKGKFGSIGAYFAFKNSLLLENENLKTQLATDQSTMANYNSVLADDASLKEVLSRKNEKVNMTLATILAKPNQSIYDTLVIDVGANQGIKTGSVVFALGNVPIGQVAEVYPSSSKVILFSNPGQKTEVSVSPKNVFMELVGRGGGNFEMIMPKDFVLNKGDVVSMPGIDSYTVAIVQTIISDPRDPFAKALLSSPVNVQELKFVEVEK